MPRRAKGSIGVLWPLVVAALVALWPPPALAGHGGRRVRHAGGPQHRWRQHGKLEGAKRCAGGGCTPAPASPAPAPSR